MVLTNNQKRATSAGHTASHQVGAETWGTVPQHYSAQERPLGVSSFIQVYAVVCVCCFFFSFLLLSKKLRRFGNLSLRHKLLAYIEPENALYDSEKEHQELLEHHKLERGMQVFEGIGLLLLVFNLILNSGSMRPVFLALQILQLVLYVSALLLDIYLLEKGHVALVRTANQALRFAYCSFQSILFAVDLGDSVGVGGTTLGVLPVSVYVQAIVQMAFEGVGVTLEGVDAITGMAESVIPAVFVACLGLMKEDLSDGLMAACGVTSLVVWCVATCGAMSWKLYHFAWGKFVAIKHDDHHQLEEDDPSTPSSVDPSTPSSVDDADSSCLLNDNNNDPSADYSHDDDDDEEEEYEPIVFLLLEQWFFFFDEESAGGKKAKKKEIEPPHPSILESRARLRTNPRPLSSSIQFESDHQRLLMDGYDYRGDDETESSVASSTNNSTCVKRPPSANHHDDDDEVHNISNLTDDNSSFPVVSSPPTGGGGSFSRTPRRSAAEEDVPGSEMTAAAAAVAAASSAANSGDAGGGSATPRAEAKTTSFGQRPRGVSSAVAARAAAADSDLDDDDGGATFFSDRRQARAQFMKLRRRGEVSQKPKKKKDSQSHLRRQPASSPSFLSSQSEFN